MSFNWSLRVPFLYQNTYRTLRDVEHHLTVTGMHPAAIRRHLALMHSRSGKLGVGGGWRKTPSNTSAASRLGRSFHQDQDFADGFRGFVAIDYVWADGPDPGDWHDGVPTGGVPVQGSAEAELFGIHANVGTPGQKGWESWHGQPVEVDGWGTATGWGAHPAPALDLHYPLPAEHDPYPVVAPPEPPPLTPDPPSEDDDMTTAMRWNHPDYQDFFLVGLGGIERVTPEMNRVLERKGVPLLVEADSLKLDECLRDVGYTRDDLTPV